MEPGTQNELAMGGPSSDPSPLERRVAALENALRELSNQTVLLAQASLERAQRDEIRIALSEAPRVISALGRASTYFPKTRTVVFVGRGAFSDNLKYAFLALSAVAKERRIRCVYLSHDEAQHKLLTEGGFDSLTPNVSAWSQADAKILLSASLVVLGDNFHAYATLSPIHFGLLQGAKAVQLWHGIPLKEIGLQHVFAPGGKNILLSDILGSSGFFEILVGPSREAESDWRRSFGFKDYAATGNPRDDIFYRQATKSDLLDVDVAMLGDIKKARDEGRAVLTYCPTFRDHIGPDWFEKSGVIPVLSKLQEAGHMVLINLHPFEQGATEELQQRYPALRFFKPKMDTYPLLKHATVFVTDYSSLAFDMLHVDCPQVFFRPDHEDYMANARAMIPGREAYTAGPVVTTAEDLAPALENAVMASKHADKDTFKAARAALRQKLFDYQDGGAGARLADLLTQQLDNVDLSIPK